MKRYWWYVALIAACISTTVVAGDRDDYNRRLSEHYFAMFRLNDANNDNVVSREEATGTIELVARFDDLDIDRDGSITLNELTRYVDATFR